MSATTTSLSRRTMLLLRLDTPPPSTAREGQEALRDEANLDT